MKIIRVIVVFIIFAVLISPFFVLPKVIKIRKVTCTSQFGPCNPEIQAKIDSLGGKNLAETDDKLESILSENILVEEYFTQFRFPDEISVDILETKPMFALRKLREERVSLIDKKGHVIAVSDSTNLPMVETEGEPPMLGDKVEASTLFALNLIYDMFSSYGVQSGTIVNSSFEIDLNGGPKVLFPLAGDREVLRGSLTLIISRLNSEDEISRIEEINKVNEIDLRYKNPIIR